MKKYFIIILVTFLPITLFSQEWVHIYGEGQSAIGTYIIEDYDKGYDILGMIGNYKYIWIQKTDINGEPIWDKRFGNSTIQLGASNIERTPDNGYIICGSWTKFNTSWDAFLLKLNSCYEMEWCKTLITPTNYDMGIKVKPTPEGDILLLGAYFATNPVSNTSLFKFNPDGELIWQQYYPLDSIYYDDQPTDLLMDDDGYLIVTRRYYPDPGQSGGGTLRTNYIKTDTAGNQLWNTVYVDSGYYYSRPWGSNVNQYGHYYTACTHMDYGSGDNPALIKVLHDGTQSYNHDIVVTGTFNLSGIGTVDFINDTNLIMFGGWLITPPEENIVVKADTFGNLRKVKNLPETSKAFTQATKTFDDKFVSIANDATGGWKVYAVKVNSDLEYDSLYTQLFTYDSLCPYPIVSTTVDPDCDNVYVGIDEPFTKPETTKLTVFPNPAMDHLTIDVPKYLVVQNTTSRIPSTTVYHQWSSATLEAWDLFGKKLLERQVTQGSAPVELDISLWPAGIVVFRLIYRGETVATEKLIVE